jgi:hypothetical protein
MGEKKSTRSVSPNSGPLGDDRRKGRREPAVVQALPGPEGFVGLHTGGVQWYGSIPLMPSAQRPSFDRWTSAQYTGLASIDVMGQSCPRRSPLPTLERSLDG